MRIVGAAAAERVPWWSFGKVVIAAAVLRLADERALTLDRPVEGQPFTPRMLLSHRAGLADYGSLRAYHDAVSSRAAPWSPDDLMAAVARALPAPPAGAFAYSNVGYLLLRRLVERTADAPLDAALERLVFAPLGLRGPRLAATPADLAGVRMGPGGAGYHPGWVYHGLLVGRLADAVAILHALLSGRLVSGPLLREMTEATPVDGPPPGRPWRAAGYGLGLMIGRSADDLLVIGHTGGGPGSAIAIYAAPALGGEAVAAAFAEGEDATAATERAAFDALRASESVAE